MQSYFTINKKVKSRIKLLMLLTIIIVLFQLVSIRGAAMYLEYIALLIFMLIFLKSPKPEFLSIVMFLLPSNQYINLGSTSIITILVTLYFFRSLVFNKRSIYMPLLISSLFLIGYATTFGIASIVSTSIKTFLYLFFCIDIFTDNSNSTKEKYIEGIKFLVLGIIVSSFISMLLQPEIFQGRFSLTDEQSTNTLGILAGFAIGCILMLIQRDKYMSIKNLWFYAFIPLAAIGFMTRSRSFVFIILIAIIWCLVFAIGKLNKKRNIKFMVSLLGLGVLSFIVINNKGQWADVVNTALERIINPKNNDLSTGRFDIWRYYINEILENKFILFFGKGAVISSGIMMLAHNLWLEQLYYFGIVGNIIIILMYGISIRYIYKKNGINNLSFYGWLPLVMIFASSFFSHTFNAGADTIRFFLAVVAVSVFAKDSITNRQLRG